MSMNGAQGLAANTTTVLPRKSATRLIGESLSTRMHRSVLCWNVAIDRMVAPLARAEPTSPT